MAKPTQELLYPERSTLDELGRSARASCSWLIEPLQDRMFLPLAGLWILGLDWLLFPPEAATLDAGDAGHIAARIHPGHDGVFQMQRRFGQDDKPHATAQSARRGRHRGPAVPMAGTVIGGWILATSGLIHLRDRFFRK